MSVLLPSRRVMNGGGIETYQFEGVGSLVIYPKQCEFYKSVDGDYIFPPQPDDTEPFTQRVNAARALIEMGMQDCSPEVLDSTLAAMRLRF